MRKTEMFEKILNTVCLVIEVSRMEILSSNRREEVVDARTILVRLLSDEGFYVSEIAGLMKKTSPGIRYLLKSFESRSRMRKFLKINMNDIQKYANDFYIR